LNCELYKKKDYMLLSIMPMKPFLIIAEFLTNAVLSRVKLIILRIWKGCPFLKSKPGQINHIEDLEKLPILEKDDVRDHYQEILSTKARRMFLYKCHTSGTTGKPLTLYRDLRNITYEHAFLSRQWFWGGLGERDLYATLKGEMVVSSDKKEPPFWRLSRAEQKLIMSSYHLSEHNADAYIDALLKYKPVGIEGYPSSIYALARFMQERRVTYTARAVFTTSETLYDHYRELIEKVFQCPVFDYYGNAERVAAIHTCEYGNGERELVGTALTNFAMPLIRYRVGDVVKQSDKNCPCGRDFPVVEFIIGRKDDYLITPDGKHIGRLDHVFKGAQHIVEAQIVQTQLDAIEVKIVPDARFTQSDGDYVYDKLRQRIGKEMSVSLQQVESLPRGGRGKFRTVVSKVNSGLDGMWKTEEVLSS